MRICEYPVAPTWPANGAPPYPGDGGYKERIEDLARFGQPVMGLVEYETDWVKGPGHLMVKATVVEVPEVPEAAPERPKTGPYARSYVRSLDGAVMVDVGFLGFVSETWAVKNGYLTPGALHIHKDQAVAVRKEARAERKARKKTWKQHGVRRAKKLAEQEV